MSEREALQSAANEARTVARAAREFGRFLDDYAKFLTQPTRREQAAELHLAALKKLDAINARLLLCSNWVVKSGQITVAPASNDEIKTAAGETSNVVEPTKPRGVRVRKKETK